MKRLEAAIEVLGGDNVHIKGLQAALRIARAKNRVVPVSERVEACKLFLERAKKRVQRAQEVVDKALTQRAVHEEEVAEAERLLALLQAEAAQPEPLGTTSVTQLQQQLDALVREHDALRANPHQDGRWTGHGPPSVENIPIMPTDNQGLHGWFSDRNCELRNAMEFGDAELVAKIGGLVGQGLSWGCRVATATCPWMGNPVLRSCRLIDGQAKRRCLGPGAGSVLASQR